jgi:hypothetical protein
MAQASFAIFLCHVSLHSLAIRITTHKEVI